MQHVSGQRLGPKRLIRIGFADLKIYFAERAVRKKCPLSLGRTLALSDEGRFAVLLETRLDHCTKKWIYSYLLLSRYVGNISIFTLIYCRVNVVMAALAHYLLQMEQMRRWGSIKFTASQEPHIALIRPVTKVFYM